MMFQEKVMSWAPSQVLTFSSTAQLNELWSMTTSCPSLQMLSPSRFSPVTEGGAPVRKRM